VPPPPQTLDAGAVLAPPPAITIIIEAIARNGIATTPTANCALLNP
jgi:hypothetical protein